MRVGLSCTRSFVARWLALAPACLAVNLAPVAGFRAPMLTGFPAAGPMLFGAPVAECSGAMLRGCGECIALPTRLAS